MLDELIALGALDGDEAIAVGRRVLGETPPAIYGLPLALDSADATR